MSKKKLLFIIITAACFGLFLDIFAGRYIAAKISTWPLLNRWKILSPQAPIVINNHETVRVSDSGDVTGAIQQIKAKISSVVYVNNTTDSFMGSAINLTSDGSFVTSAEVFANKTDSYYVVLNDGTSAKITQRTSDPATGLIFFKANLNSVPVVSLASSGNLLVGDKVLFAQSSLQNFGIKVSESYVSWGQSDTLSQAFQSDYPSRCFAATANSPLVSGEAVVNTDGNIVGIWNGSQIICSDVLKDAQTLYFNNPQSILRPSFGFGYSTIGKTDSTLTALPQGALVKQVNSGSAAQKAGLFAGDVITSVGGQPVSENAPLEQTLQSYKPGDHVSLTVIRKTQTLNLILTVGALK